MDPQVTLGTLDAGADVVGDPVGGAGQQTTTASPRGSAVVVGPGVSSPCVSRRC